MTTSMKRKHRDRVVRRGLGSKSAMIQKFDSYEHHFLFNTSTDIVCVVCLAKQ